MSHENTETVDQHSSSWEVNQSPQGIASYLPERLSSKRAAISCVLHEDGEKECLLTVGRNVNCIVMKSCVEIPQDIKATVGT